MRRALIAVAGYRRGAVSPRPSDEPLGEASAYEQVLVMVPPGPVAVAVQLPFVNDSV